MGKRKANAVADCATRLVQHRSLNAGVVAEVLKELEACDLLRGEAPEKHALKKRCWRRRAAWLEKVAVNAPLPMADGTTEDWVVADPVKLWEERAARDPSFLELLSTVLLKGPSLEVLLYLDEATAGDPLHPDPQRKAWMFYVTFTAAGMNMQHHRAWQTVAVLRNARARRALAGLSGMCRALLKTWYEAGIFQGRMVQVGSSKRFLQVNLHAICADEQAHAAMLSVNGASGRRPCWKCANCISSLAERQIQGRPQAVSFYSLSEGCMHKFQAVQDAAVYEALDALVAAAAAGPKYKLKELEKNTGFKHEPNGLLNCRELRSIVPPSKTIFDILLLACKSTCLAV